MVVNFNTYWTFFLSPDGPFQTSRFLLVLFEGLALGLVTVLLTSLCPLSMMPAWALSSFFCFPWGYFLRTVCFEHLINNGHSSFLMSALQATFPQHHSGITMQPFIIY